MSKLSFSIALNMATSQFKQGAEYVKNSLRQIQYQVLGMASALGLGGIGLSNLASRFIDVARETTRARVALRNISGDAAGFKKNMDFLVGTSSKYGQELNGMTQEFFKFSAAATSAGISLQDQHTIYESFTRSIAAFGMSSADAHLSYLALSQMMSKGKVSSEELRRQLGERMPIAMEAMARAVGVTIQELDKLLKAGKLVSKDVMLPFVKEMEKMLPEVNVDNIETSINRLKNAFIKLTEDLKVGEFYKKIVDGAVKMLSTIQTSFVRVATAIISGWLGGKLYSAIVKLRQDTEKHNEAILANKKKTEEQAQLATTKRIAAEKYHNEMSVLYNKASDDEKLRSYAKMTSAKKALDKSINVEKAALLAQQEAIEKFAAMKSQGAWTMAWTKIGTFVKGMLISIRGIMSTILPMAIIGLLTNFVMKMVEARKEAQRIKNLFSDYKNEAFFTSAGEEVERLNALKRIVNLRLGTEKEINSAQTELLKMLGVEEGKQHNINKLVADRVALLEATAKGEYFSRKKVETDEEIKSVYGKYGGEAAMNKQYLNASSQKGVINKVLGWTNAVEKDMEKLIQLKRISEDASAELIKAEQLRLKYLGTPPASTTITTSEDEPKKDKKNKEVKEAKEELTEIQKIENEFAEKMREIDNLRSLNLISEKEHQAETLKISEETSSKIGALYGEAAKQNELYLATRKHVEEGKLSLPEMKGRDTTFDYKKTDLEKLREQKSILEDYIKGFDADEMKKYTVEALEEIRKKEEELLSLSDALKLAELKQDIKELNKDLFSESVDGVTGFANAMDRVANSWKRVADLQERMREGEDISGFERMVAIVNALGDSIGGLVDAWETYKAIQTIIGQLEQARATQKTALAAQNIATTTAEMAVESTAATVEVAANTAKGASKAGESASGLPFPANIIAIPAAIGAAIAAFAAIPGFSDGGIYGGGSFSGDKMLARVNSGEMILNKAQQSNLFKMLDSSIGNGNGKGFSGEIKLRLEGKDAVAIINQQSLLKSRI